MPRSGAITFQLAARNLRELAADAKRILDGTLADLAKRAVPDIKAPWPVDTGLSRAGWVARGTTIDNPVDYTDFVHTDLARRLVPAVLDTHEDWFRKTLERRITNVLEPNRFGSK